MKINVIAAFDQTGAIGYKGTIPWRLSADLKRFKLITIGHPIIMGRRTFDSIGRRPLPGRKNIVVSTTMVPREDVVVVPRLSDAVLEAHRQEPENAFVIGGSRLYDEALPFATRLHLTSIAGSFEADTFFPRIDSHWNWTVEIQEGPEDSLGLPYTFVTLTRGDKAPGPCLAMIQHLPHSVVSL